MKPHKCPVCNGEGSRQAVYECPACEGTGIVWESETLQADYYCEHEDVEIHEENTTGGVWITAKCLNCGFIEAGYKKWTQDEIKNC